MVIADFVAGYSGATVPDFHGLPFISSRFRNIQRTQNNQQMRMLGSV